MKYRISLLSSEPNTKRRGGAGNRSASSPLSRVLSLRVTGDGVGKRADLFVSEQTELSRSRAATLIDEQHTVAAYPGYLNSTYFDEIYHARTAFEHLHGMNAYEWTHPPLGKVLMMVGIQLFGMTPFGWRFMGALVGVLMVPLMYLMAKQLTKDTRLSFIAMALMALDSMHFTQTRIATIDSYAVFWPKQRK